MEFINVFPHRVSTSQTRSSHHQVNYHKMEIIYDIFTPLHWLVSREIKRKSLSSVVPLRTEQVAKRISSCGNTRTFRPDNLSIIHLKYFGPKTIKYLTALFNDYVKSCQILKILKSSIVMPIPKPEKDFSMGTSYHPISSFTQQLKLLYTINNHLHP